MSKKRILVVEDEASVRNVCCRILNSEGFEVLSSKSAEQAREILDQESEDLDLVFSDIILPKENGYDLACFIKDRNPSLPILLTTGYTDRSEILKDCRFPILWKPYGPQELRQEVRKRLSKVLSQE
jgi:DNA-binding NtrC family response regulator